MNADWNDCFSTNNSNELYYTISRLFHTNKIQGCGDVIVASKNNNKSLNSYRITITAQPDSGNNAREPGTGGVYYYQRICAYRIYSHFCSSFKFILDVFVFYGTIDPLPLAPTQNFVALSLIYRIK